MNFRLVLLLCVGISTTSQSAEQVFRAGAARSNITPLLGQKIVGGFRPYPSTHVHDELWAKCIVLDDGKTKLAFVVCDNLGIKSQVYEAAAKLVQKHTGIPRSHLMMSATHTHSAGSLIGDGEDRFKLDPNFDDEYQPFVAGRIADAVRRAVNNLQPAHIGFGSAQEPEHVFNRRWHLKPGAMPTNPFGNKNDTVKMNPGRANPNLVKPAGPIDPEVAILSVQSTNGRPIGVLANYSLHYIGGTKRGAISADYFGYFARRLRDLLKVDRQNTAFVAMLSNGTSGDINNIDFTKRVPRLSAYEKMKIVGHDVAEGVFAAMNGIRYLDHAKLDARFRDITVKPRRPDAELTARTKKLLAGIKDPNKRSIQEIYAARIQALTRLPDEMPLPLQAFRIGDIGVAAIPNEVLVEIGLELKSKSAFKRAFIHSNAGGYFGYLPTARQFHLGGYETWIGTCWFEAETAGDVVDSILSMWQEMAL